MADLKVRSITVQTGDTLWSIAQRELGDGQRWRDVFAWNVISMVEQAQVPDRVSPDYILPGSEVKLLVSDPTFEPSGN